MSLRAAVEVHPPSIEGLSARVARLERVVLGMAGMIWRSEVQMTMDSKTLLGALAELRDVVETMEQIEKGRSGQEPAP